MLTRPRPEWYTTMVKPKEYRTWTKEEKIRIYTLREQSDYDTNEIARIMGATKTQIDNQLRMARKAKKKECRCCGRPLSPKELMEIRRKGVFGGMCHSCKEASSEYKKNLRETALEHGMCGVCGKRPAIKNHTSCKLCISATHRRRYIQGLCGKCGKNPIAHGSISLCKSCIIVNRKRAREYREQLQVG